MKAATLKIMSCIRQKERIAVVRRGSQVRTKQFPRVRRRVQSISNLKIGNRCPVSSCWNGGRINDKSGLPADSHMSFKTARNDQKINKTQKKRDNKSNYNNLDKYATGRNLVVSDPNTKLEMLTGTEKPEAAFGDESISQSNLSVQAVNQKQNWTSKLLRRTISSEPMVWTKAGLNQSFSTASANRGKTVTSFTKNSVKDSTEYLLNGPGKMNTNASCLRRCNAKTSSTNNLTRVSGDPDKLRILYTTPERLTLLQGEIDQTRDILRPFIVNRARGMIDWALDELHRSINLSYVANQEFLKIGDKSDSKTKRLWMTEFFSKESTRRPMLSLPRIPGSQTLTPAVAAARESAFSLVVPSRNISVRLLSDEEKSEIDNITLNCHEERSVDYSDDSVNVAPSCNKMTSDKDRGGKTVLDKPKSTLCWNVGQRQKKSQQDLKGTLAKESEEPEAKPKRKDAFPKSGKKMLKWKRFCEALGVTKIARQADSSTASQLEQNTATDTDKPTSSCRVTSEQETGRNAGAGGIVSTVEGKVSQTLSKIRTGWKKLNDWLDE